MPKWDSLDFFLSPCDRILPCHLTALPTADSHQTTGDQSHENPRDLPFPWPRGCGFVIFIASY